MTMFETADEFDWAGRCVCEVPERPPAYGAYVCGGEKCLQALAVAAVHNRSLKIGLKFALGRRQVVPVDVFVMLASAGDENLFRGLGVWCEPFDESYEDENGDMITYRQEQYVREAWVASAS